MIHSFARRHGLPAALADRWIGRGVTGWTPLQEEAWAEGMMESRGHWIVGAPTSAGKGLLAEVIAARHLLEGERAVWLVPTRALAEALFSVLHETFGEMGLRVICATRERPESDPLMARGQFDLCVAVPEKALAWLVNQPHGLAGVGLVIADELSLLRDAERGGRFDLLLTRIMNSPYATRRIGLCLPVPNLGELGQWWGGRVLAQLGRPRPLREGVFESWSGRWRWRDRASGEEGTEELGGDWAAARGKIEEEDLSPALADTAGLAIALASRAESTILFAPTRPLARRLAELFIESISPEGGSTNRHTNDCSVREARQLARREPSRDHELLARALEHGIGIHHADLSAQARQIVEEALAGDHLQLVVATPTLAQGLNLSAVNVVHWPWQVGENGGGERPLERWRFADQGGRAGRFGRGESAGRSIVVAGTPPRAEALWRRYVLEPIEPVRSRLGGEDVATGILVALTGNAARTAENIEHDLNETFAARCRGVQEPIAETLDRCADAGLVSCANGLIRLTGLGVIAASHGLTTITIRILKDWLESALVHDCEEALPRLLALALAAPAGLWPPRARTPRKLLLGELAAWFDSRGLELPSLIGEEPEQLAAIEAAGRMLAWIGPDSTPDVEARTGWTAGMLARAGEGLAWLARAAAAIDPAHADAWQRLAARLQTGAPAGAEELAEMRVEGLGRAGMQALVEKGLASSAAIAEMPVKELGRVVGNGGVARKLREAAKSSMRRNECDGSLFSMDSSAAGRGEIQPLPQSGPNPDLPSLIEIDLQSPGVVRVAGRELRLAPLGFDLLAALAERPGCVVTRAALYQRLWPDGGPEDQQLDAHRRRLSRALAEALEGPEPIEVVRGSGFRLRCEESQIQLRRG